MSTADRKAAKAAYRERKTPAGIYAVRCTPTGQVWVGAAPNLDTIQNRIWFSLRHLGSAFRPLQAAWREHGEKSFTFEELERLDDDLNPILRRDLLKARAAHWQETLPAEAIQPGVQVPCHPERSEGSWLHAAHVRAALETLRKR